LVAAAGVGVFGVGVFGVRVGFAQNTLSPSTNWSGYFATAPTGSAFTHVSATWVIPSVTASPSGTTYSSYWVGFDGAANSTVEQCGVEADVTSSGVTNYSAWYEFAPAAEVLVSLAVHPGDTINGEVIYEGSNNYDFILKNITTGSTYNMVKSTKHTDARASAEWIAEAPTVGGSIANLANFGNVQFANAQAALNGGSDMAIGGLNVTDTDMVQNGVTVALPTSMSAADTGFNVAYEPTTLTWNNTGAFGPSDGTSWDFAINNNWATNAGFNAAYSDGDPVVFNDSNNGHYSVTINSIFVHPASITINTSGTYAFSGSGHIGGSGSLTKSGTGTVTLATSNSYSGATNVTAGRLIIEPVGSGASALGQGAVSISGNGVLQFAPNVTQGNPPGTSNVVIPSLSITGNGALDVGNNHILINYGTGSDPVGSIAGWIASGYAGGAWNGPGIDSSAAAQASGYGVGYADAADVGNPAGLSSGNIEIAYALLGDADLNGTVNGIDFGILAANFNKTVSRWDQGDFNYDHIVNGLDFTALAANFNMSASSASDVAAIDAFAAANGLLADVPEPMGLGVCVAGAMGVLARRRRRGGD
jgi:autotransporter-associated beta strand protein